MLSGIRQVTHTEGGQDWWGLWSPPPKRLLLPPAACYHMGSGQIAWGKWEIWNLSAISHFRKMLHASSLTMKSLLHNIMYAELFLAFVSPASFKLFLYACLTKEGGLRLSGTPLSGALNLLLSPWTHDVWFIQLCYDALPPLFFWMLSDLRLS